MSVSNVKVRCSFANMYCTAHTVRNNGWDTDFSNFFYEIWFNLEIPTDCLWTLGDLVAALDFENSSNVNRSNSLITSVQSSASQNLYLALCNLSEIGPVFCAVMTLWEGWMHVPLSGLGLWEMTWGPLRWLDHYENDVHPYVFDVGDSISDVKSRVWSPYLGFI